MSRLTRNPQVDCLELRLSNSRFIFTLGSRPMRRFLKLATVCMAAMLTTAAVFALLPVGIRSNCDAAVYLPTRHMDLGSVTLQEERDVRFKLVNQGKRRLVINEVTSGCGCCEPEQKAVCISPRETVEIIVRIDTRSETGVFNKVTTFTTNDPSQPQFDLTVSASVQPICHDAQR